MTIVFLSNQLFDYSLKTNKWHVATRVALLGHKVLFVDPPIRFRKFLKQIFQGRWSPRRILTLTYQPQKNLTVYTPLPNYGPFGPCFGKATKNFFTRPSQKATAVKPWMNALGRVILRSFSEGGFATEGVALRPSGEAPKGATPVEAWGSTSSPNVLWIYHVEMEGLEDYIEAIPHDLLIYDCVDNYPAFPRYRDKPELKSWIMEREKWLAKKADLIFTTAPGLQDKLSKFNKNTSYVGNAGDFERFHLEGGGDLSDAKLHLRGGKAIGFTGAIDTYKVNLPLLVKIAKAYPKYSLVLIGPMGVADDEPNLEELSSLPNVHLLGEKPYEQMPRYFSQFDVYIIPYNLNEYTLGGCFPVKFFDALAAGLPTVVTNLPCYQDFSDVCYIAKDDEDFIRLVGVVLEENSTEKVHERKKVAKDNSWDGKVKKMLEIVSRVRPDTRV